MEDFPFTYTKMSPEEMEEYWNGKMELEIWKMENGQEQDNFSKEKEKRITTNLFDSSIIYKLDFQNYSLVPSEILPFVFVSDFNMV